ncbi:hypothetical protein K6L44_16175 [Gluconacetobacter entanii]|uniref:hypothetical protein n=1 Tax=Gluconacetobacter entanii TaxID=108528 RepID=UPI001C931D5A|nr:hypothetical protein [Gluconacetobacter entanii]MBY4641489.1 hypothetical protein [Gluconacetobacter entanii]MCW4581993.1 hypothetical protein [Gluconacetobacter entanii]MCW4585265.1 hypothetical protein [Gluconacetobacter entanii]MCW4588842.1 hypothetical protein [Gluconacetobacter entanii]
MAIRTVHSLKYTQLYDKESKKPYFLVKAVVVIQDANTTSLPAYPDEMMTTLRFQVSALPEKSRMNDPIPWLSAILRMSAA